jgi:hypothetical protein
MRVDNFATGPIPQIGRRGEVAVLDNGSAAAKNERAKQKRLQNSPNLAANVDP